MSRKNQGFTLVELVVTIAILAVLAGVLVPGVSNYIDKSRVASSESEMTNIAAVFNQYRADTGYWPHPKNSKTVKTENYSLVGMQCFFKNLINEKRWDGPYFNDGVMTSKGMELATYSKGVGEGVLDAEDKPFKIYTFAKGWSGTSGGIVIVSAGPDLKVNTSSKDIYDGKANGDDVVRVISYKVD